MELLGGILLYLVITVIAFLCSIVGFFIEKVTIFDSIAIGILSGVCCGYFLKIHPALCFLIAIGVFGLMMLLLQTDAWFWIISSLISAAWALVIDLIFIWTISGGDMIWFVVGFIVVFALVMFQHIRSRDL